MVHDFRVLISLSLFFHLVLGVITAGPYAQSVIAENVSSIHLLLKWRLTFIWDGLRVREQ